MVIFDTTFLLQTNSPWAFSWQKIQIVTSTIGVDALSRALVLPALLQDLG